MIGNKTKKYTLLIIAMGLGLLGAFLAMLYLNARESYLRDLLKPKSQPIAVVVASKNLLKGDVLNGNTLSVRKIPSEFVDNNAIRPNQFDSIEGKVLQQNLAQGKALISSYVGIDFPLDFSDTIALKRRAMTIQVDEMSTFTGLLRPGNRIDIFVNSSAGGKGKNIMPVLENVEVLTTGRDSAYDYTEKVRFLRGGVNPGINQKFTTITLNVTAKQAAILAMARDQGDLLTLLRNRLDKSGSGFSSASSNDIVANALQLAQKEQLRLSTEQLAGSITVGEDGVLRDKNGVALVNQNLVIGEDGSIRTKSGIDLSSRGLSLNAKGEIVDRDGNVIDPDDLVIAADGTLMTGDGNVLAGGKVQSFTNAKQLADGSVQLADGSIIKNATLDKEGNLVLADGTVVRAEDVVIDADGNIVNKDGQILASVIPPKPSNEKSKLGSTVDYLAGGISKDGVLTVQKLPVAK